MTTLLVATLQVSTVLLVTLGVAWLLRGRAASLKHAVIATGMACAAVVPLMSAALPAWMPRWSVLPAAIDLARTTADPPAPARAPPSTYPASTEPTTGSDESEAVLPPARDAAAEAPTAVTGAVSRAHLPGSVAGPSGVLEIILAAYVAGVVAALALLALGLLQVRWLASRAEPLNDQVWQRHLAAVSRAYGVRRAVTLKRSSHACLLATCGLLRPQLLLPADAGSWPAERIQVVLLHELAHIRRNDWFTQLLAGVFRAIHWFNPLAWLACRRLRQESEVACDDAALGQGCGQTQYAGQLLALARAMARPPILLGPAPSMARRSTLRRRVASVLDPAVVRAGASRASVAWVGLALLIVTCFVAACNGARDASVEAAVMPDATAMAPAPDAGTMVAGPAPDTTSGTASETAPTAQGPVATVASIAPGRLNQSPRQVVADILELVRDALADESTASLDTLTYPITGLNHVQRHALAVVNDDGRNPAAFAANCVEIVNALINTANLASNIATRPRGAQLPPASFAPLAAALRARSAELSAALMPVSAGAEPVSSTAGHRAAISALTLAQTARQEASVIGRNPDNWMLTELATLERAASSVVSDDGTNQSALSLKLHALNSSIQSTTRQASQIARRPDAPAETRNSVAGLASSLQEVSMRLESAMSPALHSIAPGDTLASILARVAAEVPGLQLATLRREDGMLIASFGGRGPAPLSVLIEEAPTDVEAMQREDRSVISTPATGMLQQRNGMRLHTWGGEGDGSGYRVLTRLGRRVVNVSAPPELSQFVLPVLDSIARQLR
ncbi:MAG TPA: M56 family metallopeptidase [Steroidobacteraceae bacterium]|nr:M56 family metallopeptidase [Steroidobacteraceae bacterium]